MCGIVMVCSGLETWRDGGSVFSETVSEDGGMFSASARASGGFWVSVRGREA